MIHRMPHSSASIARSSYKGAKKALHRRQASRRQPTWTSSLSFNGKVGMGNGHLLWLELIPPLAHSHPVPTVQSAPTPRCMGMSYRRTAGGPKPRFDPLIGRHVVEKFWLKFQASVSTRHRPPHRFACCYNITGRFGNWLSVEPSSGKCRRSNSFSCISPATAPSR